MSHGWTGEAPFAGAALPWMPGITIRPCRVIDRDGDQVPVLTRDFTYDARGRLSHVRSERAEGGELADVSCLPHGWEDVDVTYDEHGMRCVAEANGTEPPLCYARDAEGRLTGWSRDTTEGASIERDARGRVARIEGSFWSGEGIESWTLRYDAGDRLETMVIRTEHETTSEVEHGYTYDARGNLVELARTARTRFRDGEALSVILHRTRFSYDARGQLARCDQGAAEVTYEHDGEGRLWRAWANTERGDLLGQTDFLYECD